MLFSRAEESSQAGCQVTCIGIASLRAPRMSNPQYSRPRKYLAEMVHVVNEKAAQEPSPISRSVSPIGSCGSFRASGSATSVEVSSGASRRANPTVRIKHGDVDGRSISEPCIAFKSYGTKYSEVAFKCVSNLRTLAPVRAEWSCGDDSLGFLGRKQ